MITQYTPIAQQSIVDQYVPIPFQQLQAIADENKKDYKETEAKQIEMAEKFGNIVASSKADQDKLDFERKKIEGIAEEGASNSDNLKSAEYRSKYMAGIRSVDYGTLNKIQINTKQKEKQNDIFNQLKAKGEWDDRWHKPLEEQMKNWDTEKQGIYNPIVPVAYKDYDRLANEELPNLFKLASFGDKGGNLNIKGHFLKQMIDDATIDKYVNSRMLTSDATWMKHAEMDANASYREANGTLTQQGAERYAKDKLRQLLNPYKNLVLNAQELRERGVSNGSGSGSGGKGEPVSLISLIKAGAKSSAQPLVTGFDQNLKPKLSSSIKRQDLSTPAINSYITSRFNSKPIPGIVGYNPPIGTTIPTSQQGSTLLTITGVPFGNNKGVTDLADKTQKTDTKDWINQTVISTVNAFLQRNYGSKEKDFLVKMLPSQSALSFHNTIQNPKTKESITGDIDKEHDIIIPTKLSMPASKYRYLSGTVYQSLPEKVKKVLKSKGIVDGISLFEKLNLVGKDKYKGTMNFESYSAANSKYFTDASGDVNNTSLKKAYESYLKDEASNGFKPDDDIYSLNIGIPLVDDALVTYDTNDAYANQ